MRQRSAPASVTVYDLNNHGYMDIISDKIVADKLRILFGYGGEYFSTIILYVNKVSHATYWILIE